jgi:S1-C subfamily serine protease
MSKIKKIRKFLLLAATLAVFSISIFFLSNAYLMPFLSSNKYFSRWKIFSHNGERVTIINRTEQVTTSEDKTLDKVAAPVSRSIVDIVSKKSSSVLSGSANFSQPRNGTGIILTGDGVIAAQRQAINENSDKFYVLFYDGSQLPAQLLGVDNFTDLAFFKVEASNLPAAPLNEEAVCNSGEKILILQNNGQDYDTSYLERVEKQFDSNLNLSGKVVSSSEKMEGFCRIFPANKDASSGMVINYKGELVGISAGFQLDNDFNNFFISDKEIKNSMQKAIDGKLANRPYLGLYYLSLNKSLSLLNNLSLSNGALVYSPSGSQGLAVLSGSPAEKSKILVGDVITAVDDVSVDSHNPLSNLLANYSKGEVVTLTIWRGGEEVKINVNLE